MQVSRSQVTKAQILEWLESPVTQVFKAMAEKELAEVIQAKGIDVYHPYEPQKTQEVLAGLNGAGDTWEDVIEALDGEGLMELEDEDTVED